mmetsp:Transcript_3301/g.13867  ORF Transcript_3301/g.13867 Transcript_3301/m.13867 type:complete len:219 (-) Transcript_3301:611-1267(-)
MLFTNASTSSARTCAGTEEIARASLSLSARECDFFVAASTPSELPCEKRRRLAFSVSASPDNLSFGDGASRRSLPLSFGIPSRGPKISPKVPSASLSNKDESTASTSSPPTSSPALGTPAPEAGLPLSCGPLPEAPCVRLGDRRFSFAGDAKELSSLLLSFASSFAGFVNPAKSASSRRFPKMPSLNPSLDPSSGIRSAMTAASRSCTRASFRARGNS